MNYYPHHIGDYLRDTAHLTACEDGTYRRMLDVYYASEKPLPLETHWVCKLVRARSDEEIEAVSEILRQYFTKCIDGWRNKRADDEIRKNKVRIKAAKTNGKKGGRPHNPAGLQKKPSGLAKVAELHNPNESSQNQNQNQKKEEEPPPVGGPIWTESLAILTANGFAEKAARGFLGLLCRDYAEEEIVNAVKASMGKLDQAAYIRGVLKSRPKKGQTEKRMVV